MSIDYSDNDEASLDQPDPIEYPVFDITSVTEA